MTEEPHKEKLTEKDRAEYKRLVTAQDRAILAVNRAQADMNEFIIRVQDEYDPAVTPFDIELSTGRFVPRPVQRPIQVR